jgi:hypothetical protein
VNGRSDDELEGIANRLALLVSESGEADNAGRAVGALARRVGLSGGDLKAIFLAGAVAGARPSEPRNDSREMAAMSRQISALRHNLTLAEVGLRKAERERDGLRRENETLQAELARGRWASRITRIAGGFLMICLAGGLIYVIASNGLRAPSPAISIAADGSASSPTRAAIVRAPGTRVYVNPNKLADVVALLPAGTRLAVKRLVVNVLLQWAEVDLGGGQDGYVVTTDIDMP